VLSYILRNYLRLFLTISGGAMPLTRHPDDRLRTALPSAATVNLPDTGF
jgi:hypothetical protein